MIYTLSKFMLVMILLYCFLLLFLKNAIYITAMWKATIIIIDQIHYVSVMNNIKFKTGHLMFQNL